MEEQCSPLSWSYCYLNEGIEDFKTSLLYSTLELESAVVSAHEEISRKDEEIVQLKCALANIIKERDEFKSKCHSLVFEKQMLLQQVQVQVQFQAIPYKQHLEPQLSSGTTSSDDDNITFSPSSSDENNLIHPSPCAKIPTTGTKEVPPIIDVIDGITLTKPLPENGKFLQAVREAGPLLQTLLLAGPLPQWQHPPPPLNSIDIPPVTISSSPISSNSSQFSNKRPMIMMNSEGHDFSAKSKYQKVVHQSSLTPTLSVPIAQNLSFS